MQAQALISENNQEIHSEKASFLNQSNHNEINAQSNQQLKECSQITKKYSQLKIFDDHKSLQLAFNHWKIRKLCYYTLITLFLIILIGVKFKRNIFEMDKSIQNNSQSIVQTKNAQIKLEQHNIDDYSLKKEQNNQNTQRSFLAESKQLIDKQLILLNPIKSLVKTQNQSKQNAINNLKTDLSNTTEIQKNDNQDLKNKQKLSKNKQININQSEVDEQIQLQNKYQHILEEYRVRRQNFIKFQSPKQVKKQKNQSQTKTSQQLIGITLNQLDLSYRLLDLKNNNNESLAQQQKQYYQSNYNFTQYKQLPFCIVVPSYNNVFNNRHLNNIKSIIQQSYTNYHIVFIDDASTDSTGQDVINYLDQQQIVDKDRYVVIRNQIKMQAMANLRLAAFKYCQPQEIFMIIDGDDQLIGKQVLKLFNAVFQQTKSWFVYSNFITITGNIGYSRPFPKLYPFVSSHLRAFYTQLFRNIKDEDLQDNQGQYLKAANDVAICIPILQQSHQRVSYISQITYFYNSDTGLNNHNIRSNIQKSNQKMIKQKPSYPSIANMHNSPFSVFYSPLQGSHPQKILTAINRNDENQRK